MADGNGTGRRARRSLLAAGLGLATCVLLAGCRRGPTPDEAWADYEAVAADFGGAWELHPISAPTSIEGLPCTLDLELSFDVPGQRPEEFTADGPWGEATMTFCGDRHVAHVQSVTRASSFQPEGTPNRGPEYVVNLFTEETPPRFWQLMLMDIGPEEAKQRSLMVLPLLSMDLVLPSSTAATSGELSFTYTPALAYRRPPEEAAR